MVSTFNLGRYRSWGAPALLVAEAGVNHGGDLDTALRMVSAAASVGADAIKFQTYTAGRLATRASGAYWDRRAEPAETQFDLFSRYDRLREQDYRRLAAECAEEGILFVTTPFDVESVDWLDELLPLVKVASGDITNKPLLSRIGATGKPVLLSTGASRPDEIAEAIAWLADAGAGEVALLHCTLAYPTPLERANIGALRALADAFPDHVLGYSDHTVPPGSFAAIEAAFALGARVVEKHLTLDRTLPGNDHYHALDPDGFAELRRRLTQASQLLGAPRKEVLDVEEAARIGARRSLVARTPIASGAAITAAQLDVKRPAGGIPPMCFDEIVGARAAVDIPEDTTLTWEMLLPADGG